METCQIVFGQGIMTCEKFKCQGNVLRNQHFLCQLNVWSSAWLTCEWRTRRPCINIQCSLHVNDVHRQHWLALISSVHMVKEFNSNYQHDAKQCVERVCHHCLCFHCFYYHPLPSLLPGFSDSTRASPPPIRLVEGCMWNDCMWLITHVESAEKNADNLTDGWPHRTPKRLMAPTITTPHLRCVAAFREIATDIYLYIYRYI